MGPFRITKEEFIELVGQLDERLSDPSHADAEKDIYVQVDQFSEDCQTVEQLNVFLRDIRLPKVVRGFSLTMWVSNYQLHLTCCHAWADYSIRGAKDAAEARSIEDVLVQFRNRHGVSRLMSAGWGFLLGMVGFVVIYFDFTLGFVMRPEGRVFEFLIGLCGVASLAYIVWSYYTRNNPSLSFRHSLLYMDKEPGNSALWILISTVVIGIVVAVLSSFVLR